MSFLSMLVSFVAATTNPHPKSVKYPIVVNAGRNAYAAIGFGTLHTVDCTVTADGPAVVENGAKAWITFLDSDGEYEGDCQLVRTESHR
jgi:hypothetical protein